LSSRARLSRVISRRRYCYDTLKLSRLLTPLNFPVSLLLSSVAGSHLQEADADAGAERARAKAPRRGRLHRLPPGVRAPPSFPQNRLLTRHASPTSHSIYSAFQEPFSPLGSFRVLHDIRARLDGDRQEADHGGRPRGLRGRATDGRRRDLARDGARARRSLTPNSAANTFIPQPPLRALALVAYSLLPPPAALTGAGAWTMACCIPT
jgi:hypothetical protein